MKELKKMKWETDKGSLLMLMEVIMKDNGKITGNLILYRMQGKGVLYY